MRMGKIGNNRLLFEAIIKYVFGGLAVLAIAYAPMADAQTWEETQGPFGGTVMAVASNAGGDLFAAAPGDGIFRSTDNGESWVRINTELTSENIYSLIINHRGEIFAGQDYGGHVFRSTDNGATWTQAGLTTNYISAITVNGAGDLFVGTRYDNGAFRSTDNGDSWTLLTLSVSSVFALAVNGDGDIFAGTDAGVFRSTDNGDSWTQHLTGLISTYVQSFAFNAAGDVFAGTGSGVFRSTDNGDSWTQTNLSDIFVDPLLITDNGDLFAGTGYGIYHSSDNGDSWAPIGTGLTNPNVAALAVNGSGDLFAGVVEGVHGFGGIFRSTDNGDNWTRIGLSTMVVHALAVNGNGLLYAGTDGSEAGLGALFRSSDNGESWIQTGINSATVLSLAVGNDNHIFAGADPGVFRSTDDGENWTRIYTGMPSYLTGQALAVSGNGYVFAGTQYGVYRTTADGDTWTEKNAGLANTYVMALVVNDNGDLFAGTQGGIFRSDDDGDSWMPVNTGLTDENICALAKNANGDLFAGTWYAGGIFRSTDNGDTWTQIIEGLTTTAVRAIAAAGNLYVGTNGGGVFRSTNNGDTWTEVNTGLTNSFVAALTTDRTGGLFAGTNGGGVFRANVNAKCAEFSGMFCDDFENDLDPAWTQTEGSCSWEIADGILGAFLTSDQTSCVLSVGDNSWSNYIFETDVRGNDGVDKIVRFRQADNETRYFVNVRSDYLGQDEVLLGRQKDGVETIFQTVSYPSQNGTWYHLRIACVDERISIYIDDNPVIIYDDLDSRIYTGGIGLVCFTGSVGVCGISFDNVTVADPFPKIMVEDPGVDYRVGDYVSLFGYLIDENGEPYIPPTGNIGVEDPISRMSALVSVDGTGHFNYTTSQPSEAAGMWLFVFGLPTDDGMIRQPFNVPLTRTAPRDDLLNSSRFIPVESGTISRPMSESVEAFSGRNDVEVLATASDIATGALESLWGNLKADLATGWQRTTSTGVNRQVYQNAEMFAQKCNPMNPLDGNCANLTASYAYLFSSSLTDAVWGKAEELGDILYQGNVIDACQQSEWQAALDVSETAVAFIGVDFGKTVDVVSLLAQGAGFGDVLSTVENSFTTCEKAGDNPYPFAAVILDPDYADAVLVGLIPKIPRAVVISGYSPIEIEVTDARGRTINKNVCEIPGAQYIIFDSDLDGDPEQSVIVPVDTIAPVEVTITPDSSASPTDTFSVYAHYTYYQDRVALAENLPISQIPQAPIQVETFENLPPYAFDLLTAPDTAFSGLPCLLRWNPTADPNPGHVVSYRVVIATQSDFSDSAWAETGQATSYEFTGELWGHEKQLSDTLHCYWKV